MLSKQQWQNIFCLLKELEPRRKGRGRPPVYSDALMVWLAVWAAAQQWPLTELAAQLKAHGWPSMVRHLLPWECRRRVPDASRLSRRWRQRRFFELMDCALAALADRDSTAILDGTILPVGHHSRDPDARFGGKGSHFQKGFRLVRITNCHGQPWAVRVAPADRAELPLAAELVDAVAEKEMDIRRIVADKQFDSEPFHEQIAERLGAYLLAPRHPHGRRPKKGKRRVYRGRHRGRSHRLLRTAWGRHWWRERRSIERSHGWLKQRPHNLYALPPFIRTLPRVRRWVVSHEILQSFRKQCRLALRVG